MGTCAKCNQTLSLYEYNRVGDDILCDTCSKSLKIEKAESEKVVTVEPVDSATRGASLLLRNAPHLLWIRRVCYLLFLVMLIWSIANNRGDLFFLAFGFLSLIIIITKDSNIGVKYICANSNCRAVNKKHARFCFSCGTRFFKVEFNEKKVEDIKKREWK